MKFSNLSKSQLNRDQMRMVTGGNRPSLGGGGDQGDGPDGECNKGSCSLNGSEAPCSQFDTQSGRWFCSYCCI